MAPPYPKFPHPRPPAWHCWWHVVVFLEPHRSVNAAALQRIKKTPPLPPSPSPPVYIRMKAWMRTPPRAAAGTVAAQKDMPAVVVKVQKVGPMSAQNSHRRWSPVPVLIERLCLCCRWLLSGVFCRPARCEFSNNNSNKPALQAFSSCSIAFE